MLTEQRHKLLLELVNKKKSITVTEAKEVLNVSESTIRRDIIALHNAGKLTKVFGGAIALEETVITEEPSVDQRVEKNKDEKSIIAEYAASLVEQGDFVYIDAGTTTGYMLGYLNNSKSVFVTNAVTHAKKLALRLREQGIRCEVDVRNEKIGYKIREAQLEKVPYMIILGDKEKENEVVAVRSRNAGDLGTMTEKEFVDKLTKEITEKVC